MHGEAMPPGGFELEAVRGVADAQLAIPELEAPAIVIAADHQNRNSTAEAGECGRGPKRVARHDAAVGEPELEEVAVQQQRVAH